MSNDLSQYHAVLLRAARASLEAVDQTVWRASSAGSQEVDLALAIAAARLLLDDEPALYRDLAEGVERLARLGQSWRVSDQRKMPRVIDASGHSRPVYWAFVTHLHLAAFALRFESLPQSLWASCEEAITDAVEPARAVEAYTGAPPDGAIVDQVLWQAVCLMEFASLTVRDVDMEIVDGVVDQIGLLAESDGALHERRADESLDAWTYRELCGLHALARLAVQRRNRAWARWVERIAIFHMDRTQPDHTTNQPWAVFAFLWSPKTRLFADQQIHDATSHGSLAATGRGEASHLTPLAGMLLADAASLAALF